MVCILDYELENREIVYIKHLKRPPYWRDCLLCGEPLNKSEAIEIFAILKGNPKISGINVRGRYIPKWKLIGISYFAHIKCIFKFCSLDLCLAVKNNIKITVKGKKRKQVKGRIRIWFHKYVKQVRKLL